MGSFGACLLNHIPRLTKTPVSLYKLVEGYRKNGTVCHRVIVNLGRLEQLSTVEQKSN
jgi:hypothetical protein